MNETFISYSRQDLGFIQKLFDELKNTGIDAWLDKDDIPSGSLWRQEILVGIQFCHNFIYAISPSSAISEFCRMELDHALALNKRIIPIVVEDCAIADLHPAIQELNFIFFKNFEEGLRNLLQLLDSPFGISYGERLDSQIRIMDKIGSRTFPLYRNQYRIGRNPQAPYSLAGLFCVGIGDEKVSRNHATLIRRSNRWCVADGLIEFNHRGMVRNYQPSSNGLYIERCQQGKLIYRNKIDRLYFRPLINEEIIRLSADSCFIYEEIVPHNQEQKKDDNPTFTGENY